MRKIVDIIVVLLLFSAIALAVAYLSDGLQQDYSGKAFVVDGDTVIIDQEKIRLEGIDAPERSQMCKKNGVEYACGKQSQVHLRNLIRSGEFYCSAWQRDKYDRLLGQCYAGSLDVNAKMVLDGWALSFGGYFREEKQAQRQKSGMWKGSFQRPVDWRQMRGSMIELPHKTGKNSWWKIW